MPKIMVTIVEIIVTSNTFGLFVIPKMLQAKYNFKTLITLLIL